MGSIDFNVEGMFGKFHLAYVGSILMQNQSICLSDFIIKTFKAAFVTLRVLISGMCI